ncbi:MAG: FHA domain-containing protein [Chloroflexota bacterium]
MENPVHNADFESSDENPGASTIAGSSAGPKLQVLRGDAVGKVYNLKFKTRAGRETDNDITIVDPMISRYHFQISYEDGRWILSDLGSVNGTKVNGLVVGVPQALSHEDKIQVGETVLLFRDPTVEDNQLSAKMDTAHGPLSSAAKFQTEVPAQPANSRGIIWIVGGLILLLILGIVVLFYWLNRPVAQTAEPTEEAIQPVTILRTTPLAEQNLFLKYDEDFRDSFGGWDDASGKDFTKRYGNNRYHIEITTNNLVVWGLANREATDFELEVEAAREQGGDQNTYGIIFRYVDVDNYYRFDLSGDGYFLVSKFEEGVWSTLEDWTFNEAINQGESTLNVVKVSAIGSSISISANGEMLTEINDSAFPSGNFGFFASTFEDPHIWVSFDNLKLWAPENQEISLIPTPDPNEATPVVVAVADIPTATATATDVPTETPTPTETPETVETPTVVAEEATETPTPTATATATETPTPAPTATETPVPEQLPDFVSREQPLARGETALTGLIYFPVFDASRGTYDIYRSSPNGTGLELIQSDASQVALNKNGTTMAYRSWKSDERGLFSRPVEGGDKWRFVQFFEAASPIFSENEDFFGFHSRQGGSPSSIYRTLGVDHEVLRREGIPIQGEMVALTPDNRIIYRGCLGGSCGLIRSNLDGTFPQALTTNADDTAPSVSPDGQTIAFMSNRDGNWELYAISVDGQNLSRLTNNEANDGIPTWSPDGRFIAFATNRDGKWSLWRMNANGGQQRQLFDLDGSIDGIAQVDTAHSFGWIEERIDWTP